MWKLAHNTANAENEILKKSVQRLERSIGSIKVCLFAVGK